MEYGSVVIWQEKTVSTALYERQCSVVTKSTMSGLLNEKASIDDCGSVT